ncbi:MAG: glycosyltransferase, partial [Candidatus Omnitrophica bacterium]|nr:glycosyltransferase [Candidatus Omnitrophota bacterium]
MEHRPSFEVSLVIPAYNEERRLGRALEGVFSFFRGCDFSYEIIVVDDGSCDGTERVADEFKNTIPFLTYIKHERNLGKAEAVRKGILVAQGEYICFSDADFSTPVHYLREVVAGLKRGAD